MKERNKDRNNGKSPIDHEKRKRKSIELEEQGPLVAATIATIALMSGNPLESYKKVQNRSLDDFSQSSRRRRLIIVCGLQQRCIEMAEFLNPGCKESNIAFHTRRLDLIETIIKSEIAEGLLAVNTADLLLGRFGFGIEGDDVYFEWDTEEVIYFNKGKNRKTALERQLGAEMVC